ncbi:cell wall hydrolase [Nitratireductor luteus]|uniref:cell wall hydrolase n=1 Tax=Nitratireductor luteus TaxID=2976980 RepID=UPI00223FD24B|nr:cell wall hydrolase [Nitratireductor luteus]
MRARKRAGRETSLLSPICLGLAIWIGFPTAAAYQDMASMISGQDGKARWMAVVERSVAGSVHQAEMPFADETLRSEQLSGAGMNAPGIGEVALRTKASAVETPDEERINRAGKQGRIVHVAPVAPPKFFNAGSVLERTGALLSPKAGPENRMAFTKPDIKGREVQIAQAFHIKHDRPATAGMPSMIAELVNNDEADILATAYAPPEPDYAKASPFASILKEEKAGRFIPPVAESDHPWARRPLPASVFSDREQQCLAAGIYFEARGEVVKGQAAVAQVILNRVRNPTYPNTICGVVYQNKEWRNRCQFSFACDGIRERVQSPGHYKTAEEVAMAVTAGKIWLEEVGSSTHYHATYVRPRWASAMERMNKIGQHIFYRTYGGGWN